MGNALFARPVRRPLWRRGHLGGWPAAEGAGRALGPRSSMPCCVAAGKPRPFAEPRLSHLQDGGTKPTSAGVVEGPDTPGRSVSIRGANERRGSLRGRLWPWQLTAPSWACASCWGEQHMPRFRRPVRPRGSRRGGACPRVFSPQGALCRPRRAPRPAGPRRDTCSWVLCLGRQCRQQHPALQAPRPHDPTAKLQRLAGRAGCPGLVQSPPPLEDSEAIPAGLTWATPQGAGLVLIAPLREGFQVPKPSASGHHGTTAAVPGATPSPPGPGSARPEADQVLFTSRAAGWFALGHLFPLGRAGLQWPHNHPAVMLCHLKFTH